MCRCVRVVHVVTMNVLMMHESCRSLLGAFSCRMNLIVHIIKINLDYLCLSRSNNVIFWGSWKVVCRRSNVRGLYFKAYRPMSIFMDKKFTLKLIESAIATGRNDCIISLHDKTEFFVISRPSKCANLEKKFQLHR